MFAIAIARVVQRTKCEVQVPIANLTELWLHHNEMATFCVARGLVPYPVFCGSHTLRTAAPTSTYGFLRAGCWPYQSLGTVIARLDQKEVFSMEDFLGSQLVNIDEGNVLEALQVTRYIMPCCWAWISLSFLIRYCRKLKLVLLTYSCLKPAGQRDNRPVTSRRYRWAGEDTSTPLTIIVPIDQVLRRF